VRTSTTTFEWLQSSFFITFRNQRAESLGYRVKVFLSTYTSPNLEVKPRRHSKVSSSDHAKYPMTLAPSFKADLSSWRYLSK
jgi:hypothetical protein